VNEKDFAVSDTRSLKVVDEEGYDTPYSEVYN
jgi:hypothetical protein